MKKIFLFCLMVLILSSILVRPVNSELTYNFGEEFFEEEEPLISVDFKDVSLKDILKVFSIQAGVNFIASEDVQDKKITLYLDKVPLSKAMDRLFEANKLTYKFDDKAKIYIVRPVPPEPPKEPITRVYFLKHATLGYSYLNKEVKNNLFEEKTATKEEGIGITEAVAKVLSKEGKVVEEPRTNSLIVTDFPERFPLVEEVIKRLDVPVVQVMLEVEMLDVNRNKIERMGIKFGDITDYPSVLTMTVTGAIRGTKFPFSAYWPSPEDNIGSSRSEVTEAGTISFANPYRVVLDLIKAQSDTKVLARPRILTLDNHSAEIKITSNEAVNQETKIDTETEEKTITYERMEVGVSLRITPQVNLEDNEITMFIMPKVSNTRMSNIASNVFDPEERTAKSVVRVKDGETIIVGGLIRNELDKMITKVPILGDIPILGAFFRHKNVERNKERELLVFITPRIVKDKAFAKLTELLAQDKVSKIPSPERLKTIDSSLSDFEKVIK